MPHRGELLEKAIKETKTKKADLARKLKISRNQLYNWLQESNLQLDILISAGKIMHYDFGKYIPEIAQKTPTPEELENLNFQIKYMELAEKLILVMEERETYRKQIEDLTKKKK